MNDEGRKLQKKDIMEETLNKIAKQLEGQVYSYLPEHGYRLHVFAPYFDGQEPTYGKLEGGIRLYLMPDFRTAILVMDILFSEYKLLNHNWVNIGLEWLDPKTNQWEEWEDGEGNSIKEYFLNENYVLHLGDGEYEAIEDYD